jgi:hypothetical protein
MVPLQPSTQEELGEMSEEQMLKNMQALLDKQKARQTTKAALSDVFVTTAKPYESK